MRQDRSDGLTVKEALAQVLADMKAMPPEQLRKELDEHSSGEFATTLREMSEVATKVLDKPKQPLHITVITWASGICAVWLLLLAVFGKFN